MSLEGRPDVTKLDSTFSSEGFTSVKFFRKDQIISIPTEHGNVGKYPHTALLGETTEKEITAIIAQNPVRVDAGCLTMMPVKKEVEIYGDSGTLGLPPKGYEKEAREVTGKVVQEIFPDHHITCVKDFYEPNRPEKTRALHDIGGILAEHGVSIRDADSPLQKRTLEGFFSDVELSPESPFGKYIRVHVVEEDNQRAVLNMVRREFSTKSILASKEVLEIVRKVRKKIGEEIFGDRQDEFIVPLDRTLFKQAAQSVKQRKHRAEARQQLVDEIHKHFPSASK